MENEDKKIVNNGIKTYPMPTDYDLIPDCEMTKINVNSEDDLNELIHGRGWKLIGGPFSMDKP